MINNKMKIILYIIVCIIIISSINSQGMKNNCCNSKIMDNSFFSYSNMINYKKIYVDDGGGADYVCIQDAIDASSNGDSIFVYNGMYNENIDINKQLVLEGENKEFTIIDGGEMDSVVTINSENVMISGFTITNCKNSSDYAGVVINSNHIKINDCNISFNKGFGIIGRELTDVFIEYNVISNNYYDGIYLESVGNSEISDNIIRNHSYMYYSYSGIIPMSHGFVLSNSNRNTVSNNVFSDAINIDFLIRSSSNINVINNEFFSRSGVLIVGGLSHWVSHTFIDNTVDGKPIYYYKNDLIGKTVPKDAGEVILANCRNFKIHNLSIHDGDVGVSVGYCTNIEIVNNVIGNVAEGIYIDNSNNNFIADNNVFNVWGVPFLYSCNNTFINNVIDSNFRYGLGIWYGSNHNKVYNNLILDNNEDGIFSYESNYNQIIFNTIMGNNQSGLEMMDSDYNMISGNTFSLNNNDGVKLSFSSTNNVFHHNNFINNSLHNARGSASNSWDLDTYGGNYWSDYTGIDQNGDGFGDEPYVIGTNIMDNFPYIDQIIFKSPLEPDTPIGPFSGKILEDISFTLCGNDPFNFDIYYLIDWGDNSDEVWYGPFTSGEPVEISHSWIKSNEYTIRVKNKNIIGIESDWSDPLFVTMPKNKGFFMAHPILHWLFERFPNLFPILR